MIRPYKIFDSAQPMVFDGNVALCFIVKLHNSVASARVKNIAPGARYTFIIQQSPGGQNTFAWPTECVNAVMVDGTPNSYTVQDFIGSTGGLLFADLPGGWSK
jgi:hypothetical protein